MFRTIQQLAAAAVLTLGAAGITSVPAQASSYTHPAAQIGIYSVISGINSSIRAGTEAARAAVQVAKDSARASSARQVSKNIFN